MDAPEDYDRVVNLAIARDQRRVRVQNCKARLEYYRRAPLERDNALYDVIEDAIKLFSEELGEV